LDCAKKEIDDIVRKTKVRLRHQSKSLNATLPLPLVFADDIAESGPSETNDHYLKEWFAPQALEELLVYRDLIDNESYQYSDLLKVILSRSARSARLTTHFDLDFPKAPQREPYYCYKHARVCYPTTDAFQFIQRYSQDSLKRISEYSLVRTDADVDIRHGDSRVADYGRVDGVITSPPYVGLIDYHEQHAYAYRLLGLHDRREDEIGPAANGSSQKAKQAYQQDIIQVFKRALDAMLSGGRLIVIAGDRASLYDEIAMKLGVHVEHILQRHVNRRTGRRSGEFFENIFIWVKP
jgi:hypothetical protein